MDKELMKEIITLVATVLLLVSVLVFNYHYRPVVSSWVHLCFVVINILIYTFSPDPLRISSIIRFLCSSNLR